MGVFGIASSFATLFLFILYFIGKFFAIKVERKNVYIKIQQVYPAEFFETNLQIDEVYNLGDNVTESLLISSVKPLNKIRAYKCYNEITNSFGKIGEPEFEHGFLNEGQAIQLNCYKSCGMPSYMIEFENNDYMIGNFYIAENGKNGILENCVMMKHTWKSYLFYLCR